MTVPEAKRILLIGRWRMLLDRYHAGFTPESATAQEDDAVRASLDLVAAVLGKLERAEQLAALIESQPIGPLPCS